MPVPTAKPTALPSGSPESASGKPANPWHVPVYPVRFITAASLFDGHDAAINIMRRVLQSAGAEVIHLGHNRSVKEVVDTAIHEDAQGIAISSYQGGHVEYFRYMVDLLRKRGAGHIRVYGGGGGVIVPEEIEVLQNYGVARIFSPEDGLALGLRGMIDVMMRECDFDVSALAPADERVQQVAQRISLIESKQAGGDGAPDLNQSIPTLGITGTGGAGKSTLSDLVEEAVLMKFERINDGGGVLGAMETMYQRSKIQEESLYYEGRKHTGELPVIGVNTFRNESEEDFKGTPVALMRSTNEEKDRRIANLRAFKGRNPEKGSEALARLQNVARSGQNTFDSLMEAVPVCSLGQITHALFEVGGQYRRNMLRRRVSPFGSGPV